MIKTAEFVSPSHPDKICDQIADTILDAYLAIDPTSRVAIEVLAGHGQLNLTGEVTSLAKIKIEPLIRKFLPHNFKIQTNIKKQSRFIGQGVDSGGAGDQGIMIGYACNETPQFMPLEYQLARNLCFQIYQLFPVDGKTQVTIENNKIKTVVASFQNTTKNQLEEVVKKIINSEKYLINPSGDWTSGGFDADTGLSGRKIVVDAYGPGVPVGGGSFSGKDYTKVDRSGAYMARKIAVDLLKKYQAKTVLVKLAYAIGKKEPVMAEAIINNQIKKIKNYNLSPNDIKKVLKLDTIKYSPTSLWGHFGNNFPWDN